MPKAFDKDDFLVSITRRESEGEFWVDVVVENEPSQVVGPFETWAECTRAYDELMSMVLQYGQEIHPTVQ